MPEYEQSAFVNADPQSIFDFVSDVRNMPKYLPTTHHAELQGENRVRVQGEAHGNPYDSDGFLHVDQGDLRMEWGSDGENRYRGWLEIDGDDGGSEVTVHLSFAPSPDQAAQIGQNTGGNPDPAIQEGLRAAVQSIKNEVEGSGGKVEPATAH